MANIKDLTGADAFTDQMRVPVWDQSAGEPRAVTGSQIVAAVRVVDIVVRLRAWGLSQAFSATSTTRNTNGAITVANIVWPDGVAGVYTADTLSTAFPGATDAWHATYLGTDGTKTVTQPAVTRDSNGAVTAQPALTIV